MATQLNKIQARFNKASKSYDSVAGVQRKAAKFLVNKLLEQQPFAPRSILDLGTGTGYIPELLLPKLQHCCFYLNDIADEMLEASKVKFSQHSNIYFLHGDMLELNADIYDCVISNFALQWIADLPHALKFFNSKSSDTFAFSTLLDGTFSEWQNILNQYQPLQLLKYPQAAELISLCNEIREPDQSFEFWVMDISSSFANPLAFMHYLKSLGASSLNNSIHLSNVRKLLKADSHPLLVTYKIFFGIFKRQAHR